MEVLHPMRCCSRRSITMQSSTQPHFLSYSSRHPHGRRKHLIAPTSVRQLSTSPPRPDEQSTSSPPAQSSLRSPQASTAPRRSGWSDSFQRPRPSTPTSAADIAALRTKLKSSVNLLDIVDPHSARPRTTTPSPSSYGYGITSQIARGIEQADAKNTHETLESVHLRLNPMLGRTLAVDAPAGFDLQSAFRALESRCARNSVRKDHRTQRFHVRRGQAKKLLKSSRWRALFKEGFLREVGRIRRMRSQGW